MKKVIKLRSVAAILLLFVGAVSIWAQQQYEVVDENPKFPGGYPALKAFLQANLTYPLEANVKGIEGRVLVSFVVNRDSTITDIKVVEKVHPLLDEEAVRVIKLMPKWEPGKKDGKAVRVRFSLPVTFRLPKDELKY